MQKNQATMMTQCTRIWSFYIYDMLVRLIADNLDKMDHELQLILVPSEVWY